MSSHRHPPIRRLAAHSLGTCSPSSMLNSRLASILAAIRGIASSSDSRNHRLPVCSERPSGSEARHSHRQDVSHLSLVARLFLWSLTDESGRPLPHPKSRATSECSELVRHPEWVLRRPRQCEHPLAGSAHQARARVWLLLSALARRQWPLPSYSDMPACDCAARTLVPSLSETHPGQSLV